MKIPFSPPYINDAVIQEVTDALNSGWITTGPKVKQLEELVCEHTNAPKTLCVNSATSGLMLALKWFGVKEGDEVIIPAYTYAATALAVIHVGATPVMVDADKDFNIDVSKIQDAITENTKAIIPVDFAGYPCDYDEIRAIIEQEKHQFTAWNIQQKQLGRILIISDSAHAIGAKYNGKELPEINDITVFSFHAVKNVTTAEGGAVCLNLPEPFNNEDEYNFLRCFSLNGQTRDAFTKTKVGSWRYDIIYPGLKINLPDVLAAIGLAQLPTYFSSTLQKRRKVFEFYNKAFSIYDWAILPPYLSENKESSCHVYALRIKNCNEAVRDEIIDTISKDNVAVNVHFQPLPMLSLFKQMGFKIENHPQAFNNYECEISLPVYPQLTTEMLNYVTSTVIKAVNSIL